MKSAFVLGRLLWRPAVLLDLFIAGSIAFVLPWLLLILPSMVQQGGEYGFELVKPDRTHPGAMQFLLFLLAGCVVGTVASFSWQDLAHCRLAGTLPGIEKQMRRGFGLLAILSCILAALASHVAPYVGPLSASLVSLAGLGLGVHLWDSRSSLLVSLVACATVVVATMAAVTVAQVVLFDLPASAFLAIPLFVTSVTLATTRSATRERALTPLSELGASFETYVEKTGTPGFGRPKSRPKASWRWGAMRTLREWRLALRFESGGSAGWRLVLSTGSILVIVQVLLSLSGAWVLAMTITAVLLALFLPQDLRRGVVYPLSRADRTELVWRGSCQQIAIFIAASGIAHYLTFAIEAASFGFWLDAFLSPWAHTGLPWAALIAGSLPLLQATRLHALDHHTGPRTSLRLGAITILVSTLFTVAWVSFFHHLTRRWGLEAILTAVAISPIALIAGPLLYRWHLRRWFRRVDLA